MEIRGEYIIGRPREEVFDGLVNPSVIAAAMPGCEELTLAGEGVFNARLKLGIAAVKGEYQGTFKLVDVNKPESLTLYITGEGGPGFVEATARLQLSERSASQTVITYEGNVEVGGLLAGVGQRVLGGIAKMLIGRYFKSFEETLNQRVA